MSTTEIKKKDGETVRTDSENVTKGDSHIDVERTEAPGLLGTLVGADPTTVTTSVNKDDIEEVRESK